MLEDAGFTDVQIGAPVDTFAGATGEEKAHAYDVSGYAFLARKPHLGDRVISEGAGTGGESAPHSSALAIRIEHLI